ncbi:MAG: lipopolysaccharide assembly protein LapB [Zoogloeaceae bacterium]|jgi:lipopolysaccharide biosynthesis regulator YciM|nr:lipopolysaccharide assembly protein LapB [Zoogloeaceae bacterium]
MVLEYWQLLLLPFFFALGWIAARVDIRHVVHESRGLPRSYFQGLNFLLNEQPDKAIDAFLEVARSDDKTVELNFALGGLFRRQGESERAIKMHQSLVDRDDLGEEIRMQALSELGQDFLKLGLLDRAEAIFLKLEGSPFADEARHYLMEIYQVEKDWEKAIAIAQTLPDTHSGMEIAHFHCELAANELIRSRLDAAAAHLDAAFAAHRKCVRASIIAGDLALQRGETEAAIAAWQKIEQQDAAYLALVAQRLLEAYRQQNKTAEGLALLRAYLERYPSLDFLDSVYQLELEAEGSEAAYRLVRSELKRNPSLLGLEKLMDARMPLASETNRGDLELARSIVQGYTRRLARYRCNHCGFRARQFYWRCPACGGWETYPPRREEEFDPQL